MRRRDFIALLSTGLLGLALPRLCLAQQKIPDSDFESGKWKWGKHIWVWQELQQLEAIEDGKVILTSRIISGLQNSSYATRVGDFRIRWKAGWWYTNHDGVGMPLAMFFDGTRALHGWSRTEPFPTDEERPWYASHGCVSVEHIEGLYAWADIETPVHVRGERTGYL